MSTSIDSSQTPTPTSPTVAHQQNTFENLVTQSANPNQAIHAPLPTRHMLPLLSLWLQNFSPQSVIATKDTVVKVPSRDTTPKAEMPPPPSTPQPSRTSSGLLLSPQ